MNLSPNEADWLYALQRPWPLTEHPLDDLAGRLGTTAGALADFVGRLRAQGLVRRIGGVFDARRLGYRSCLFALPPMPPGREADAVRRIVALPGVTHAYRRGWPEGVALGGVTAADYAGCPSIWYTLSARADRFEAEAARLGDLSPIPFPALTRYKIDVVFDPRTRGRDERTEYAATAEARPAPPPAEPLRALVRRYQDDVPDLARPFRAEDLPQLRAWQADGTLRRFALLLRHRASGFAANGMCCWRVPEAQADRVGRCLAADPDVTHCYARPFTAAFPFNLYAMIHKTAWDEGFEAFRRLSGLVGHPGKVFFSTQEFKKSSVRFFVEED